MEHLYRELYSYSIDQEILSGKTFTLFLWILFSLWKFYYVKICIGMLTSTFGIVYRATAALGWLR